MVMGNECAICLDEIHADDPSTLIPICNHGYHLDCANKWFSKAPILPYLPKKSWRRRQSLLKKKNIYLTVFFSFSVDRDSRLI
ncbi:RING-H2 finger protein ATL60 [Linum grandiflorum]